MAHARSAWSVYLYIVAFEVNIRICRAAGVSEGQWRSWWRGRMRASMPRTGVKPLVR
jgi:hypothetical protein